MKFYNKLAHATLPGWLFSNVV